MQIIPVIDIMRGVAVQACRGERSSYRPVRSVLLQGADPIALLRAYRATFDSEAVYIADLDAITGSGGHLAVIEKMAAAEPALELLVDAGVHDARQVRRLLDAGAKKVVVASESLADLDVASQLLAVLGYGRALFSLDLKARVLLWRHPSTEPKDPSVLVPRLASLGFREAILLEMDRIGTGGGGDTELLDKVATAAPAMRFIVGGGIATTTEIIRLQRAGAAGILLATALHSGAITREDLNRARADA